jgi:hypothetical protein
MSSLMSRLFRPARRPAPVKLPRRWRARLNFEPLEDRRTPAAYLSAGTLVIDGTAGNDTVELHDTTLNGQAAVRVTLNGVNSTFTTASVTTGVVRFNGYAGDDWLFHDSALRSVAYMGDGNDWAWTSAQNDEVHGGNGNDSLAGWYGNDSLYGDAGADSLQGEDGNDYLDGWTENDVVSGGAGNDTCYGYTGDDNVSGGDGNDYVLGEDGNDTASGGAGNDSVYGGAGADSLTGDDGADYVSGGAGNDTASGGNGNDSVYGGDNDDWLYGGANEDYVYGDAGNDHVYGDDGNDSVYGGAGTDTTIGGNGNDRLYGDAGNDWLYGGYGNDFLYGGADADTLYGEGDNDWLEAGSASEFADGGYGTDYNAHKWAIGGTTPTDVNQAGAGTCVIMSTLAAASRNHDLSARFSYLGGFTYCVQLYDGGWVNEYVTFDGSIVMDSAGNRMDPWSEVEGEFWTILYQRAYLQHFEGINVYNGNAVAGFGGEPDGNRAIRSVLGTDAETDDIDDSFLFWGGPISPESLQQKLAEGRTINAGGTGHRYGVMDVFQSNGYWYVTLYNPWGYDAVHKSSIDFYPDGSSDGFITIGWSEFINDDNFVNYSYSC